MFLKMAVLSGCDYLDSIKGIGIKKAHKLVSAQKNDDIQPILDKIKEAGKMQIPEDYYTKFQRAILTFKFQVIFDPATRTNLHLNDPSTHQLGPDFTKLTDTSFLGIIADKKTAIADATASDVHHAARN